MKKKEIIVLRSEIIKEFPTNLSPKQLLNETSYLNLCYDISAIRLSDALRILPLLLVNELDLILTNSPGDHGDGLVYWLKTLDMDYELCLLTSKQIALLSQWVKFVARPLYREIPDSDICFVLQKLDNALLSKKLEN